MAAEKKRIQAFVKHAFMSSSAFMCANHPLDAPNSSHVKLSGGARWHIRAQCICWTEAEERER